MVGMLGGAKLFFSWLETKARETGKREKGTGVPQTPLISLGSTF
jgi:hypothetical protein